MKRNIRRKVRRMTGVILFMTPTILSALILLYAMAVSRGKIALGGEWILIVTIGLWNVSLICKMMNNRCHKEVHYEVRNQRGRRTAQKGGQYHSHTKRAC